jgi:hypothetical protein
MKLTINYLPHSRSKYSLSFIKEILKIDKNLLTAIKINVLCSENNSIWKECKSALDKQNVDNNFFIIYNGDYITKLKTGLSYTDEYFFKLDEDVFIPYRVWEFILQNLNILDFSENAFLAPLISTGIPTVDLFIESFCDEEEKDALYKNFLETKLPSIWGADYSHLEDHTIKSSVWSPDNFYNSVKNINHYYKGVHPVRFSAIAQNILLNSCLTKFDKLCNTNNMECFTHNRPYFCNSAFATKKTFYENVLNSAELFKDPFDEVPLNLYIEKYNLNKIFIKNGYAVHPSYNTLNVFGVDHAKLSDKFFEHEYFQ